jgi:hypothetical protein
MKKNNNGYKLSLHAVEDESGVDPNITKYVGLSLIIGFTMMLILDQGFLILQEKQMKKE